jgi:hypothetical protein
MSDQPTGKIDVLHLPGDAPDAFAIIISGVDASRVNEQGVEDFRKQCGARAILVHDEIIEVA